MIKPTVGRVVWYTPSVYDRQGPGGMAQGVDPLAALIVAVHGDRMVNLAVFDANGKQFSACSVTLVQPDDTEPPAGRFCEWMPFQKEQAWKTEELEKPLSEDKQ